MMFVHLASARIKQSWLLESPLQSACLNERWFQSEQLTFARDLSDLVTTSAEKVQANLFGFSSLWKVVYDGPENKEN